MDGLPPAVLVLIVAALSASAGALLTLLIVSLTGDEQREDAREATHEAGTPTDDLLRVVRTESGAEVFVRGRRVRRLQEIEDRETGQQTIAAVKAVLAFAEAWLPALEARPPATGSPPDTAAAQRVDLTPPGDQGSQASTRAEPGGSDGEPLNLVQAIDSLIQKRLQERPDLAELRIRLTRDLQGRPLFYVGRERYRSANEIPHAEISTFIQETIRMWERIG